MLWFFHLADCSMCQEHLNTGILMHADVVVPNFADILELLPICIKISRIDSPDCTALFILDMEFYPFICLALWMKKIWRKVDLTLKKMGLL